MMTLAGALSGMNSDSAIDLGTDIMNAATDRQSMLPIHYANGVPKEYSKKYDRGPFYDRMVTVDKINITLE